MTPQEKQAARIVIRTMSDDELRHESKKMWKLASFAQGMADRIESELRRRRKKLRMAMTQNNGEK